MKNLLLVFTFLLFIITLNAQTTGDYRSVASGDWNILTTWEHFDGTSWQPAVVAPAYTDQSIVVRSPHSVNVTGAITVDQLVIDAGATLVISAGTTVSNGTGTDLTVDGTLQVAAALAGAGTASINGLMTWTGGTITAQLTIQATSILNISGAAAKAINTTVVNNGVINWSAGNIDFNAGTLTNNAVINNSFDGSLNNTSGTNSLINAGSFTKSAGTGNTTIAIPMISNGNVQVNTGVFLKTINGITNSGIINIASGAEFRTNSLFVMNAGTTLSGNGTVTFANLVTNNVALNVPSAILMLQVAGSNISGPGSFTINGIMSWTGGTMAVVTNVITGAVINMSSTSSKTISNTINNDGTINWSGGSIFFANGALSNNGTIDIKSDNSMSNFGGVNMLTNTGLITKTAGTLISSIIVPFNNTGTLNVSTGTLTSGGLLNLNAGTILSGTGTFGIDGTVNVNIPMSPPSSLTIKKASGTTNGTQTFTINGVMNWQGGAIVSPFVIMSGATLSLSTGPRALNSTITNNGVINWNSGGIDFNNGTLINAGTMSNSFDGSMNDISGTNLFDNSGTFSKIAGTATFSNIGIPVSNTGTINVSAGTLQQSGNSFSNSGVINFPSGRTFSNTGTLVLQPTSSLTGTGTLSLSGVTQFTTNVMLPVGMTLAVLPGCTSFGAGTCTVNSIMNWSGGTIGSSIILAASSTLNASGAGKSLYSSMTINGNMLWTAGDIIFNDGTLTNNGTINQSFDGVMDVFGGANLFTNAGTFSKTGGAATTTFNIPVTNTGTIDGGTSITFSDAFSNSGTLSPGRPVQQLSVSTAISPLLTGSSNLHIHMLDGTGAGSGHDKLTLNQNFVLDGTLTVTDLATMPAGSYTIVELTSGTISGSFASMVIPAVYSVSINATSIVLLKSTLPLNMISFSGRNFNGKNILNWVTENEIRTESFEIERSSDARSFQKIGFIASKDSHQSKQYVFEDANVLSGTNYYRLKQLDVDGKFEYSKTIVVSAEKQPTDAIKIYPNPSKGNTVIVIPEKYQGGEIIVRSMSGQTIKAFTHVTDPKVFLTLPKGNYFVQIKHGSNTVMEKLIIE